MQVTNYIFCSNRYLTKPFTQRIKQALMLSIALFIPTYSNADTQTTQGMNLQLEEVIIFSRHGLRAPILSPTGSLGKMTPNTWPQNDDVPSYLTVKGGVLETYFGHYFNQWFTQQGLLEPETCPDPNNVRIYANSMQRTIATGQFFALGAFPACDINVYHRYKMNTMDELFSLNITNDDPAFVDSIKTSIVKHAGEGGIEGISERFKPEIERLQTILDYKNSVQCLDEQKCDFFDEPVSINITKGKEPNVKAPFRLATSIVDAFLLQYYEGKPLEEIAWGKLKNIEELQSLVAMKEEYMNLVFKSPVIADHVTKNLFTYIHDTFENKNSPNITLLIGHDSNVSSLLAALGVKEATLPEQIEISPIGSKIVFQKWRNTENNELFMKVDLVYQSAEQIAKQIPLSLNTPPKIVNLNIANCEADADGFCSYQRFIELLHSKIM